MLTESLLRQGLKTKRFGSKIYTFDTIDSTNNCARALAACWANEGIVVIAEEQTAGRGRLGRSWQANPNENLTFSLVLRPTMAPEKMNLLPLYVAVAVGTAIEHATGLKAECKWPNDLLIKGKKIAGILLEGAVKQDALEYVVVGIGINVNQVSFPPEIADRATSLKIERGREIDRPTLFREILSSLEHYYKTMTSSGFDSVIPLWLSRSNMMDKHITVSHNGGVIEGTVSGLSADGALILRANGSETTLFAGDVTILNM